MWGEGIFWLLQVSEPTAPPHPPRTTLSWITFRGGWWAKFQRETAELMTFLHSSVLPALLSSKYDNGVLNQVRGHRVLTRDCVCLKFKPQSQMNTTERKTLKLHRRTEGEKKLEKSPEEEAIRSEVVSENMADKIPAEKSGSRVELNNI